MRANRDYTQNHARHATVPNHTKLMRYADNPNPPAIFASLTSHAPSKHKQRKHSLRFYFTAATLRFSTSQFEQLYFSIAPPFSFSLYPTHNILYLQLINLERAVETTKMAKATYITMRY